MRRAKYPSKIVLAACCALAFVTEGASQAPIKSDIELHFGGLGTDGANAIVALSDGGFALGGWKTRDGNTELTEGWVLRVDARGGYVWDIPLPNSAPYGITALSPAFDSGLLVIDGENVNSKGTTRLSKLSPEGSIEWQRTYGNTEGDALASIRPTFDGGFIIAGKTYYRTAGDSDGWVLKLDRNQDIEWFRVLGDQHEDSLEGISLSTDGGFVAVGWTTQPGDIVLGWALKLDSTGATEWNVNHNLGPYTEFHGILPAHDGSFVYSASKEGDLGTRRSIVIGGLTRDGALTWQQGINADGNATVTGIAHAATGSFIISAYIEDAEGQAGLAAGFGDSGSLEFIHRYSGAGDQRALAITAKTPNGYAIAGSSQRIRTLDQDMWLLIRQKQ
ncbi:MAG: hypothetical protein GKS03_15640 [Alphaproteobacteria bacterium]|nr:hypothetical protein [Alphaproteobacteria bacterium]